MEADVEPKAANLLENIGVIAYRMPAFCGPDGKPLSWRHYIYALGVISREEARDALHIAHAARMGINAEEKAYREWRRDLRMLINPLNNDEDEDG